MGAGTPRAEAGDSRPPTSDKLESIANRVAALVEDVGKVAGRRPTDISSELNPTPDLDRSIATQLERGLRDVLPLTFVQGDWKARSWPQQFLSSLNL